MMAIGQGSSSAPLAFSGNVNCVGASSLRPPPLSEPSVGCGVGTTLPNGVATCVLDAHPDKQVRALVTITTPILVAYKPAVCVEKKVPQDTKVRFSHTAVAAAWCRALACGGQHVFHACTPLPCIKIHGQRRICLY